MARGLSQRGFSLVEVMVALVLLSAVALGLGGTLVVTQRAQGASARRMQAAVLAAQGVEQLRANGVVAAVHGEGGFERQGTMAAWNGRQDLVRLEVAVSWSDGAAHTYRLATLARR